MKHLFVFAFVAVFSVQAFALGESPDCGLNLKKREVPVEVRDAFKRMRQYGLTALLDDVYAGRVEVVMRPRWSPWQPNVSARTTWTGQKKIVIRRVENATAKEEQKFYWDLALALFELRMNPWTWKNALQMPHDWQTERMDQSKLLLRELYIFFLSLGELKAEDLMPAKDPGAHWAVRAMVLKSPERSLGPNLEDFEFFKRKGLKQFEDRFDARYERGMLFGYYMNQVKRMMIATSVASTLMLAPHLLELPGYIEAQQSWMQYQTELEKAPEKADVVMQKTLQHQREREIRRLTKEIELQEARSPRDETLITNLKIELQANVERGASGAYSTDPVSIDSGK